MSSKFVPGGQTVVSVKGSKSVAPRELRATGGNVEDLPLVVDKWRLRLGLRDRRGAIQDYNRA
ncbi:MAG: hypothetical protein IPG58_17035 [Acidobacteria bacterium]|nr:hypothetical protein [Acidobacteriota bacterium]